VGALDGRQVSRQLETIARDAMVAYGLEPDFPAAALAQLAHLGPAPIEKIIDLRALPWSSIDNDDSRDLDQLEVCVKEDEHGPTRVLIAIADVDALVPKDSPLDKHAAINTTSVYTPAIIFPMLPRSCRPIGLLSTRTPTAPPWSWT
jgi:exoribonuclease-2